MHGMILLMIAAKLGHVDMTEVFLKSRADVQLCSPAKQTAADITAAHIQTRMEELPSRAADQEVVRV